MDNSRLGPLLGIGKEAEVFAYGDGVAKLFRRPGAKAAAFACKKFFSFKSILPCHYGTFPGMLDPDASKFVEEMKGHNVLVPKIGETVTV